MINSEQEIVETIKIILSYRVLPEQNFSWRSPCTQSLPHPVERTYETKQYIHNVFAALIKNNNHWDMDHYLFILEQRT